MLETATRPIVEVPSRRADRIGRGLMWVNFVATLVAFADGVNRMVNASDDRLWVEGWRTFAYLVFAGLFALIALRPRGQRGLWELILGHKTALVVFAVVLGGVPEARLAGLVDFALVLLTAMAYVLCRGWRAWRTTTPYRS
jgi:hypothetical protein